MWSNTFLTKIKQDKHSDPNNTAESGDVCYFKLPIIGQFSKVTQSKINNLCIINIFVKDLNILNLLSLLLK